MARICAPVAFVFLFCGALEFSYGQSAYPSMELDTCTFQPAQGKAQRQPKKKIIDLTHEMRSDIPMFGDDNPLGQVVKLVVSMDDGFDYNLSELRMIAHSGTHLDTPGHFVNEYYKAGHDVSNLDLDILVGPVLIVDTPRDSNITAKVLEKLNIPHGVERLLFRTSNSDKGLMWNPKFDSSYTGFTIDGAEWLVHQRPDVKLIGTDYLSVAAFDDLKAGHRVLLSKKLILVEGLNLDNVQVGLSNLYCLPMRLPVAEGCPCRCILVE